MTTSERDEFPERVKRALGLRVNFRCSNPNCGAATTGPRTEPEKYSSIGVAAHITGAARRGPRRDPFCTPEWRASAENGIWLCQNCAKLIDSDPLRFGKNLLQRWKANAEAHSLAMIGKRLPFDKTSAPELNVFRTEGTVHSSMSPTGPMERESVVVALRKSLPDQLGADDNCELLDDGIGGAGQPYAILGIGTRGGWDWEVIFFTASEFGWDVIARSTLVGQKGYTPIVKYILGRPGALALTHVDGYGSGLFRRSTTWYRIAKGEVIPLLSYPISFHVSGWGLPFDRELETRVLSFPKELAMGAKLTLAFTITYSIGYQFGGDSDDAHLFSTDHRLSLLWDATRGVFAPETVDDSIPAIDELWAEGVEGWLRRNSNALRQLAQIGTPRQRAFIETLALPES